MSFWVVVPSYQLREDVCLFSVEVGVQALNGEKTRRTVLRRFSDFVALAARLRAELGPEKSVPPEPPKQRLARVDDSFLNERRKLLEAWLWLLLGDVEIAHSHALTTFLELAACRKGLRRHATPQAGTDNRLAANAASPTSVSGATPVVASVTADTPSTERARGAPTTRGADGPASTAVVGLSTADRAAVRRTLSALQQRYAASKADLSDALACLRSDAAVKALLSRRVDELEQRVAELSAARDGAANAAPAATLTTAVAAKTASALSQNSYVPGDDEDRSRVSLQWELEEARLALRTSKAACEEQACACAASERAALAASAEAEAARAEARALHAQLLSQRAAAEEAAAQAASERRVLAKEVKSLRRELADANSAATASMRESAAAARAAVTERLSSCIREASVLRERLAESTVEHLAAAEQSDGAQSSTPPLELLSVSDARVALLTAEAQLLCRSDNAAGAEAADAAADAEARVREALSLLLADNASLRRQVNSLLRAVMGTAPSNTVPAGVSAPAARRPWWQPGQGQQ